MATRTIREQGDAALLKKSRVVTDFNVRMHTLLDDMRETLLAANGVGLAAPQVGVLRRAVLVLDLDRDGEAEDQLIELLNPEIIETRGEQEGAEGCLSIPGVWGVVKRPNYVKVRAQDRYGNWFEAEGTGLTARAFCHELDHLDGHLFTDFAERILTEEEMEKMAGDAEEEE